MWYENPKRTALFHCSYAWVHDHIYFIILLDCKIWSLNTFKWEWVMGFPFPWPILSCIDIQSKMYCRCSSKKKNNNNNNNNNNNCRIPIILCGRQRVIRWKYNNFHWRYFGIKGFCISCTCHICQLQDISQEPMNQAITPKLAAKVKYMPNKGNPWWGYFI